MLALSGYLYLLLHAIRHFGHLSWLSLRVCEKGGPPIDAACVVKVVHSRLCLVALRGEALWVPFMALITWLWKQALQKDGLLHIVEGTDPFRPSAERLKVQVYRNGPPSPLDIDWDEILEDVIDIDIPSSAFIDA